MGRMDGALSGAVGWPCGALERGLRALSGEVVARLDARGEDLCLVSRGTRDQGRWPAVRRAAERLDAEPGPVTSVALLPRAAGPDGEAAGWAVVEVGFAGGASDRVALRLGPELGPDGAAHVLPVLLALWPAVRQDCLRELSAARRAATDALLWIVSQRLGAAVLVLDASGRVVQANAAASVLLARRDILRERGGALAAGSDEEDRALRRALAECLAPPAPDSKAGAAKDDPAKEAERIVFLRPAGGSGPGGRGRVPVSVSRFEAPGGEPLAVVVVPTPPEPERIEALARRMGLTPAEARVAAMMQMGLPNREAAAMAGLKEQTFNTYAKRVLAKLDVGCRAEVAQLLTWQAGVGREAGREMAHGREAAR